MYVISLDDLKKERKEVDVTDNSNALLKLSGKVIFRDEDRLSFKLALFPPSSYSRLSFPMQNGENVYPK